MTPPSIKVAVPDTDTLLRVSVLSINGDLRVSAAHPGRIVIKHAASDRLLVLHPLQWQALRAFEGGRGAPAALKHLVFEQGAIPVREFYELILQALRAGVLATPGYPPPEPMRPTTPFGGVTPVAVRALGTGCLLVAVALLMFNPPSAPAHPAWWALGWTGWALAASAGAWLRAGLVRAAGGDVYRAGFRARSALPRYAADTREAVFHGPQAAIDQTVADLAPHAALCALASVAAPSLAVPAWCGLLAALAPLPGAPGLRLLRARFHSPSLTTTTGRLFPRPRERAAARLRARCTRENLRFAVAWTAYAAPWALLAATLLALAAPAGWSAALLDARGRPAWGPLAWFAGGGAAVFTLLALTLARASAGRAASTAPAANAPARPEKKETTPPVAAPRAIPHLDDIDAFLADTHPLQNLPAAVRQRAAAAWRPAPFRAGDILLAAGDTRRRLHLLYSGEALVDAAEAHRAALPLSSGCLFGETCLLENKPQPVAVRARADGVLLIMEHTDYLACVAPHVPPHKLEDAARKVAFLRQAALARRWPAHQLDGFARRATLHEFGHGDVVLHEGQENVWFHLLIEGELHVLRDGRRRGRLQPGDFFGEISLLRRGFANADVVGHRPGRYLAVPRNDFLVFFAHDPDIALQIEDIASRRLGRPVFPA